MAVLLADITQGRRLASVGADAVRAHVVQYSAGADMPWHAHERASLTLLLDGAVLDEVDGGGHPCSALAILYKPAGAEHATHTGPRGARSIVFEISADVTRDLERAQGSPRRCAWRQGGAAAAALLGGYASMADGEPADFVLAVIERVLTVERQRQEHDDCIDPRLAQAVGLMRSGASVSDAAGAIGLHPVYFSRRFRDRVGASPARWRLGRKVAQAARRLALGDEPIALVAIRCGFTDQSHLCRVFKREIGRTPAGFRELLQRDPSGALASA